jgi:hypothetical protein
MSKSMLKESGAQHLAGLFSMYTPTNYSEWTNRILYIGKATRGSFGEGAAVRAFNGNSAFWSFARKLSQLAEPECKDLSNLCWSNIFKQGVIDGNPKGALAKSQSNSAIASLARDIRKANPSLVVCVAAGYHEGQFRDALRLPAESDDFEWRTVLGEPKWDLYFRKCDGRLPPIVWMYHPQGKRIAYTEAALNLVSEKMGWKRR